MFLISVLLVIQLTFALQISASKHGDAFDYVIVGGGTCGLAVASRLSENPDVTVAVIEAGDSARNNPNVTNPFVVVGSAFGSDIDWAYQSTPQAFGGGRRLTYHSGKALGGSSTINGMTYIRAEDIQIDAWEKLGNPGWNWKKLLPYYREAEGFQRPTAQQRELGVSFRPTWHGFSGPVGVGWPKGAPQIGNVFELLRASWANLGVPRNPDPNRGIVRGFSTWPMTANATTTTREDSASAYYWPAAAKRKNLKVFTNTVASKLIWDDNSDHRGGLEAKGVQVKMADGTMSIVCAKREVVLSAGALRSPLLLEHSGVGNPAILKKYSIPVKLSLPSVGENMQDQPLAYLLASTSKNYTGFPTYVAFVSAADLFGDDVSSIEASVRRGIPKYAQIISRRSGHAVSQAAVEKLLRIQADLLFARGIPMGELFMEPFDKSFALAFWLLIPFSRGSVHVRSGDMNALPAIDPAFFEIGFDLDQEVAIARMARRFYHTAPVSDTIKAEIMPGVEKVPVGASDEDWGRFIKRSVYPNYHAVGTLSMMSRKLGGVVDPKLIVYGTKNVRVVDASVMPTQVCGHLTATLYAIAERAVDMIRATW